MGLKIKAKKLGVIRGLMKREDTEDMHKEQEAKTEEESDDEE